MQTHKLIQGTPEWHAHRRAHFNASDAPAMMGVSPYKTRDQLIAELATGIVPEVGAATQRLYDSGHIFEALARPLAEDIMGEDLYPATGTEGELSASFDGLTLLEDKGWEHKRLNARLRAAMVEGCRGSDLPIEYQIQMEHQSMVSNSERTLFTASEWTQNRETGEWVLVEARHCWYEPNAELRNSIRAGWEQLRRDVAAYQPPEAAPAPVVAKPVAHLPVVFDMRVEGKLIACNLEQYKPAAMAYIDGINTVLETDQDFADAKADAKFCRDSADKLELAVEQALGQMGDVNQALNTVREIAAYFDVKALALEKLTKTREDQIRADIVAGGINALREHIAGLNAAMPAEYMPTIPADFGGVVKGKRTREGTQSAVNDELARAKIAASDIATRIHANLKTIEASGLLVHDTGTLVLKAPDDLAAILATRVAAEQKRKEDERIANEQAQAAASAPVTATPTTEATASVAPVEPKPCIGVVIGNAPTAPVFDISATMTLGQLNTRIAPIKLDASGIEALGFAITRVKAAVHFPVARFPELCAAIARRAMEAAQAPATAEAA